MDKAFVHYKGQVIETKNHRKMSESLFNQLRDEYYAKPTMKAVRNEVRDIFLRGHTNMRTINDRYFKELFSKVKLYHCKWSIEEVFEYKPLLETFYNKTFNNDEVYPPDSSLIRNIETAFRVGGAGVASKPSNFRLDQTIDIIKKYNLNNNYYDPSCGWGVRLVGSLATGVNYYGTDPNGPLIKQLHEVAGLFKEVDLFAPDTDIREQGSEIFVPEWVGKMGMVFTSPPYFFLEDYKLGEQSTKLYPDYHDWLNQFLFKTFQNAYQYLIPGGHILINIKKYAKFDLENDTQNLLRKAGFNYAGIERFKNITRINGNGEKVDNDEGIYVYKKPT